MVFMRKKYETGGMSSCCTGCFYEVRPGLGFPAVEKTIVVYILKHQQSVVVRPAGAMVTRVTPNHEIPGSIPG